MKKSTQNKVWFLVLFLAIQISPALGQTTGNSGTGGNIDVKHHKIYWRINPDSAKYIRGTVTTHFVTKAPNVNTITFDLNKTSFNNTGLVIKYHGNTITKSFPSSGNVNVLTINLPTPLPLNTLDSVSISYKGVPPSASGQAFGYQKANLSGNKYIYTLSESYEDRDWWPCKADMQDKIESMDITVSTPAGYSVATQGKLFSTVTSGTNQIYTYKHRYPVASYLVSVCVAKFQEFNRTPVMIGTTSVPIVYQLFNKKSYTSILSALDFCKPELELFSARFGDYPFKNEKLGFYEFGFPGGMEHQTNIGLDEGSLTSWSTIAHETAHQWFGDGVTCKTWNDLWLNEGFATYMEVLAAEQIPALGQNPITHRTAIKNYARSCTVPVYISNVSSSNTIWTGANNNAVYYRGAMIVSMLRALAGDAKFYEATKNYIKDPVLEYNSAATANLKQHFEASLGGANLGPFFADWVNGVGTPSYNVEWNANANAITLKLTQTRSTNSNVAYFHMPVVLKIKNGVGTAESTLVLYDDGGSLSLAGNGAIGASTGNNKVTVNLPFAPSTVAFDPDNVTIANGTVVYNGALAKISGNDKKEAMEKEQELEAEIFPNPSSDEFTLKINPQDDTTPIGMIIVNALGSIVERRENVKNGNITFGGNLSAGVYIIHLSQGNKQQSSKIIKK